MKTVNYEQLIERSYRAFESGNADELDKYFHRDVVIHTPDPNVPSDKKGIDYLKEQMKFYHTAFGELSINIKEIFVKEDKAIAYFTGHGRNTGELHGMPPTGREVNLDMCEMFRFKDDKISDYWSVSDNLSFLMQLGILTEEDLHKKGGALI